MAIDVFAEATVREVLVKHYVEVIKKQLGFQGNFYIKTRIPIETHDGINTCLGNPLTFTELRTLFGHNYVEEKGDKVAFNYETGMTGIGAENGAIYIVGDRLTKVFQHSFAPDHLVLL